jgi:hypothetical protein
MLIVTVVCPNTTDAQPDAYAFLPALHTRLQCLNSKHSRVMDSVWVPLEINLRFLYEEHQLTGSLGLACAC